MPIESRESWISVRRMPFACGNLTSVAMLVPIFSDYPGILLSLSFLYFLVLTK